MKTSLFEIFELGIAPSSSLTVGPMRAPGDFVAELNREGLLERVKRVQVELYGSLALTRRVMALTVLSCLDYPVKRRTGLIQDRQDLK